MKRAALLGVVVLAGCGSAGYAPTNLTTARTANTGRAGSSGASGNATVVVQMRSIAFVPNTVTVRVGQTVEWVNNDAVIHNVTALDGHSVVSGSIGRGGRFSFRARAAGTISYYCTIHASAMKAQLVIQS